MLIMNFWKTITRQRFITILVLFLVLIGLCIYYYDNFQNYQEHPGTGAVLKSYPTGEMVAVSGTVTQTFPGGFYMVETYEGLLVTYKIITTHAVHPGDKAQVLGVLGPDYTITVHEIKVTEKWSYQFLLLRSFIVLLFLLFIFHRYWRFNWKEKVFMRRR
jgi:hypothetical protein